MDQGQPNSQKLILKIKYNEIKFKHCIQDEKVKFQDLKIIFVKKLEKYGKNVSTDQILCTDEQNYKYLDDDLVYSYLQNDSEIILVDKQKQILDQQNIRDIDFSLIQKQNSVESQNSQQNNQIQQQQQVQQQQLSENQILDQQLQIELQQNKDPVEAIVVLFDVSGSMGDSFFNDKEISRIGAVNAFFSAFSDKTIAFELNHIVQLICFDDKIQQKCDFINDFNKFITLVDNSAPGGSTRLYDSLQLAVTNLNTISKKYPNIIKRIIALTDGEDNASKQTPETITQLIVDNDVILDSFVVSYSSVALKQITFASGGRCYCPTTLNQGLKLFEIETILSVISRGKQFQMKKVKGKIDLQVYYNQPFDTEGLQVEIPKQINDKVQDIKVVVQSLQNQGQASINIRIIKELEQLDKNQSKIFKVFPTSQNINVWKVLLKGPIDSPYVGGVFLLLVELPSNYPFGKPKIKFITKIYHCDISDQGQQCIEDNWSPIQKVENVIKKTIDQLINPDTNNALDSNIASLYLQKKDEYIKNAKDQTQLYAKRPIDEVMKDIMGNQIDEKSEEYKQKKEDIKNWLALPAQDNI